MTSRVVTVNEDDLRMAVDGGAPDQETLDGVLDRLRGAYAVARESGSGPGVARADLPTANPGVRAIHGPPYTGHEHLVRGFSPEGWPAPEQRMRCGGPGLCGACSAGAERIRLIEGVEQPRLGYATTRQLLDELVARLETGGTTGPDIDHPTGRFAPVITLLGDVKESIAKLDAGLLAYRTAGGDS